MAIVRRLLLLALLLFACHAKEQQHRVIFIGLDGGDWQLLDRYMPGLFSLRTDRFCKRIRPSDVTIQMCAARCQSPSR